MGLIITNARFGARFVLVWTCGNEDKSRAASQMADRRVPGGDGRDEMVGGRGLSPRTGGLAAGGALAQDIEAVAMRLEALGVGELAEGLWIYPRAKAPAGDARARTTGLS